MSFKYKEYEEKRKGSSKIVLSNMISGCTFFRTFINVNLPKKLISVFEADQNPSLRPGATWKELVLQPTIVELFFELHLKVRGSAERWSPGCVNAAGRARQKWQATAGTNFTKPGDRLLAEPCMCKAKLYLNAKNMKPGGAKINLTAVHFLRSDGKLNLPRRLMVCGARNSDSLWELNAFTAATALTDHQRQALMS